MNTQPNNAPACPVCGDDAHLKPLCKVDGFDVLRCATCTAEHAQPVPSERELKAFYDRAAWFEGGEKGGYDNYDVQSSESLGLVQSVLERYAGREGLMVLDVGCGYGTHLKAAADRGWTCFGVEISNHARAKAQDRLGPSAYIVESVGELFSHKFDLILMLDVLEHVPSPYTLLYQLYSIGAITPETTVVIATPNAGSAEAQRDPAAWNYRHPPSHLVYYTADALTYLLRRLHFKEIEVRGVGADNIAAAPGLLATASGSDFMQFMHERYVPGTWSKIAAYEHMPRYALAANLAAGKRVLDFGCGTGYGAATLAAAAKEVTGLDIDAAALSWAREVHRNPKLNFVQRADLGAGLPDKSFDLITCFEMIEHVDHETQKKVVAGFARLLRDDGVMLISTPNPEVTKHYDANPYHIREMTEAEFRELLSPHFTHIQILRQHLQPAIAFEAGAGKAFETASLDPNAGFADPLAYIAVCSRKAISPVADGVFFDTEGRFIEQFVTRERSLNIARFNAYKNGARAHELEAKVAQLYGYLKDVDADREAVKTHRDQIQAENARLHGDLGALGLRHHTLQQQHDALSQAHDALKRQRDEELRSPRFLAKQLWQATKQRLRDKL